jgi:hypothetical protein
MFLSYGGRPSCAPPPGPRAQSEVRLAWGVILFFGRFWSFPLGPSAKHSPLPGGDREYRRGQKCFLARSGRSSCALRPGPRALCEMGLLRAL